MKTKKIALANMKGKLSRDEMKKIMAGTLVFDCGVCFIDPGNPNSGTTSCFNSDGGFPCICPMSTSFCFTSF